MVIVSLFVLSCSSSNSTVYGFLGNKLIEYPLVGAQYAVLVVMDGVSENDAKRLARQRAAEVTVSQGNRYFTVDSMKEVVVLKSDDSFSNQRFYGNMYQELIIQKDFGRDSIRNRTGPNTNQYPAIRLVFTMYEDQPNHRAIDACSLTPCQ